MALAMPVAVAAIVGQADLQDLAKPDRRSTEAHVGDVQVAVRSVFWRIGLAAIVYGSHRQALAAAQASRQLETRRTQMVARLAESRLRTTRARVQPEAFIEELRALRSHYFDEPASAEATLEAMFVRLRAASRGVAP